MGKEPRDDTPRFVPEIRSELLRAQLRRFADQVGAAGKGGELFELEMWLRSFERFFRIGAQSLSQRETRALALRNWSEELRLVNNALMRVVQLSGAILTEEDADLSRFDRYVGSSLAGSCTWAGSWKRPKPKKPSAPRSIPTPRRCSPPCRKLIRKPNDSGSSCARRCAVADASAARLPLSSTLPGGGGALPD